MLRPSTVRRLAQTSKHFIQIIPEALKPVSTIMSSGRPNGLIANKGIELLTFGTPNGHKASILLEELKEAYGKPEYTFQSINITESMLPANGSSAFVIELTSLA